MKPDTPLLQLTAREFASMLAWHAKLCQRDGFIDVEKECRKLFGEPEPNPHQHVWTLEHKTERFFDNPYTARCECGCGMYEAAPTDRVLLDRLARYGPVILK